MDGDISSRVAVFHRALSYDGNVTGKTLEVKQKKPNLLGLYDMSGNVWEWCFDSSGLHHFSRGGSWRDEAFTIRIGDRDNFPLFRLDPGDPLAELTSSSATFPSGHDTGYPLDEINFTIPAVANALDPLHAAYVPDFLEQFDKSGYGDSIGFRLARNAD
jgi:hypothetical protein